MILRGLSRPVLLAMSHGLVLVFGFLLGIYLLPILAEPEGPGAEIIQAAANDSTFSGEFVRDLEDSDAFHWGEGTLHVGEQQIAFEGELAPGPDYRLYLSPEFVETESDFEALKSRMAHVGHVMTFDGFVLDVPEEIDPAQYSSAIVWCESFGQFISAAKYQ